MPEFHYQNQSIPYVIRSSNRARRMRLQINAKGLQVILPQGQDLKPSELEAILKARGDWIVKTLKRLTPPERHYNAGEPISYLGENYPLHLTYDPKRKRIKINGIVEDYFQVMLGETATPKGLQRALKTWYLGQAKRYLPQRLDELATRYGFTYHSVRVREQKSQWGSCSSTGNLSLNSRLILASPALIDYVIIHELCHLKEMNHSPQFWAWVALFYPNYKAAKRWFKEYGAQLQF